MLVIRAEYWPNGRREDAQDRGTAVIAPDGPGTEETGTYGIRITQRGDTVWKAGKLENFPRKLFNTWDLAGMALVALLGDRWVQHQKDVKRILNVQRD